MNNARSRRRLSYARLSLFASAIALAYATAGFAAGEVVPPRSQR